MIRYEAMADDVARIRFSLSPLGESVYSMRMLASPELRRQHLPWVHDIRPRLKSVDLRPLRAVIPPSGYIPDFLTPAPGAAPAGIDEELEAVRATDPEEFVQEVAWMAADTGTPAAWRSDAAPLHRQMLARPERAIGTLTEVLRTYWRLALEPYWRRLQRELHHDIGSRMRIMESSGAASVFSSLHERVAWDGSQLSVQSDYEFRSKLDGQGIVLVPSIFCGSEVLTMLPPLQSMVVYPRPGGADIWKRGLTDRPGPLAALVGKVRSSVIESLVIPASTSELAAEINCTPGAISQHISVLRDCNIVVSRRVGRRVIHSLTETGEALLRGAATG
ncbi:ArsR family transcriptional regulator [Streptomyces sp. NPDC047017]|uniref:ArsR family transcriptional regulator n=1 Tax=Streptomyces sp. NPDC047017 TaxID=3155024 RepID=UPI0033D2B135